MTNFILPYLLIGMIISIVFAVFIGKIGSKKEIGGTAAFIVSLLLSPLLGLVIVLASEDLKDGERKPVDEYPVFIVTIVLLAIIIAPFFINSRNSSSSSNYIEPTPIQITYPVEREEIPHATEGAYGNTEHLSDSNEGNYGYVEDAGEDPNDSSDGYFYYDKVTGETYWKPVIRY